MIETGSLINPFGGRDFVVLRDSRVFLFLGGLFCHLNCIEKV